MANVNHLNLLIQCAMQSTHGNIAWNNWRATNNIQAVDLSGENYGNIVLHGYNLAGANFSNSDLTSANLLESIIVKANFSNCNMQKVNLSLTSGAETDFRNANMSGCQLGFSILAKSEFSNAILQGANCTNALLGGSNFSGADLRNAILLSTNFAGSSFAGSNLQDSFLSGANISNSNLSQANISRANVFGISAWNIQATDLIQNDLIITNDKDPNTLTVDDIEIAQFIYLISNNKNLARVIENITSKMVLILGRFTKDKKKVLDAIKDELRKYGYVSVVFDFEKPSTRDLTETIGLLGRMSKFIVADLTEAKSIPQELSELVPGNPSLVIQPIILKGSGEYGMFEHWKKYQWVLDVHEYDSEETLLKEIKTAIIEPAEKYLDKAGKT